MNDLFSLLSKLGMNMNSQEAPLDLAKAPFGKLNPSLTDVLQGIKNNKFHNVVVACGAGISVAAGIPDFRTPGTGLYYNLEKYHLPYAEAIFDIKYFKKNPRPFFHLARDLWPKEGGPYKPTRAHKFIKKLSDKGLLMRCFTQNIDGLENLAGIPEEKIVAAHGNFFHVSCVPEKPKKSAKKEIIPELPDLESSEKIVGCGHKFTDEEYKEFEKQVLNPKIVKIQKKYFIDENGEKHDEINSEFEDDFEDEEKEEKPERKYVVVEEEDIDFPRCPHCGGLAKPDITFFGEGLPEKFFNCSKELKNCDLLIVMGTSLQVHPFCTLVDMTTLETPRVLVNKEAVGPFRHINKKRNVTDVVVLGDIEHSIKLIERELGWETEDEENERIEEYVEENVSEESKNVEIDMEMFEELKEMGYDEDLCRQALIETESLSVAHAVNWLVEKEL